jgi:hypothetical protein
MYTTAVNSLALTLGIEISPRVDAASRPRTVDAVASAAGAMAPRSIANDEYAREPIDLAWHGKDCQIRGRSL